MSTQETWHMENGVIVETWTWEQGTDPEFGGKSEWGPGPWADEPDKLSWTDPVTQLPCLIVRGPAGVLCGYAGILEPHPWFGREAYLSEDGSPSIGQFVSVHGGLTYSGLCSPGADEGHGICHVPQPGESDHVWWFGFDCGHAWDLSPGMNWVLTKVYRANGEPLPDYHSSDVYRDVRYVMAQVSSLSQQLAAGPRELTA